MTEVPYWEWDEMDLVGNKVISAFLQLLNFSVDVVVVYKKGSQNPKKGWYSNGPIYFILYFIYVVISCTWRKNNSSEARESGPIIKRDVISILAQFLSNQSWLNSQDIYIRHPISDSPHSAPWCISHTAAAVNQIHVVDNKSKTSHR